MLSRFKARAIEACPACKRAVWTSSTYIAASPQTLVDRLTSTKLAKDGSETPAVTLYAMSKNIPSSMHSTVFSTFAQSTSIGVVSELLPTSTTSLLAPALDLTPGEEAYSIAVASYAPTGTSRAVAFQSSLTGRPNISLGREHKPDSRGPAAESEVDAGLEAFLRGKRWGFGDNVNLQEGKTATISELEGVPAEEVKQIVSFTADRIQPFLGALSSFPHAAKVGMVGTSTPFHSASGAPYSLLYNGEASATGAVGVAIIERKPSPRVNIDYAGFEPFGEVLEVTSAKGNIVLTLGGENAAKLLLGAVQALPSTSPANAASATRRSEEKERGIYAAVFDSKPEHPLDLSQARHVSQVMAGDPSRGAVSVETEEEVREGYFIAFLHRELDSDASTRAVPSVLQPLPAHSLAFLSVPPSHSPPQTTQDHAGRTEGDSNHVVTLDAFVAASENGVLVSKNSGGGTWVCAIEGVGQRLG